MTFSLRSLLVMQLFHYVLFLQISPSTKVRRGLIERRAAIVCGVGKNQVIAFAIALVGDNRVGEDQSDWHRRGLNDSLSKYLESPTTFPSHL